MHTIEDEKNIKEYEKYILRNGIDRSVIDAYCEASKIILCGRKDREYGLKVSTRAKELIFEYIKSITNGADFNWLETQSQKNKQSYDILDKYYDLLLYEAPYILDSYILYIEKNRPKKERFYEPRRKTLKQVADKLQELEDGKLDELFIHMPPRVGKLISDDTPVFTSKGWKKHGDLKVGDLVVGFDGRYVKVICVHPKHHTTHTVFLSNGESIDCHENHEWTVFDRRSGKYRTVETKQLIGHLKNGNRNNFMLPHKPMMDGEYKENLKVPPYVLGAWLGDGTNRKPFITGDKNDHAIIDKIVRLGYKVERKYIHKTTGVVTYGFGRKLVDGLRFYNMCFYTHTMPKHIPVDYLTASIDQRLELLAGLIDTDGCFIKKENRYQFTTADELLKNDFETLINSFGWRCCTQEIEPRTSSSGIVGRKKYWNISFNPTEHIPCALYRKKIYEFSEKRRVAICDIKESEHKPGNCITVDSEDGLYMIGKTMIPTHNSQIITLAMSWHCAKDAEKSNLYVTYKEGLGGAFLTGVMEIWTDPTYCFSDVFPKVKVADTDSKNHKVDLVRKKKYKTLSGKGLESGLNGEYDAYGWMVLDDILEGIQDVLNPDTLKRKQIIFDNNVMSRKKEQCKLIHNGTIWSLHDLYSDRLDFLQNNPEAKNIRYDILKIPALDENDESNFDYDYGVGYTTQYYRTLRAKFEENDDMASWYAQYQQEPIERDGAVFNPEHMRFYNGVLPEEEPYRICAACDVALGGEDFLAFAVAYMYEDGSIYIDDVVFDNSEKKITKPKVANMIIDNDVGSAFFEANQGGEGYKDEIEELLKKKGRKINLRSEYAPTNMRKAQRIWDKAGSIREFYFRDVGCRSQEYRKFMTNLYSFTVTGKNKHEDAADCLASLAYFIEGNWSMAKIEVPKNPFRGGYRNYGY